LNDRSDIRTREVELDEISVQYDEVGQGGRPLVLLHGLTGHRKDFEVVMPELGARGLVVAPDLRGHGDSSRIGQAEPFTFDNMVGDVRSFLDKLEIDQCDLLGHSFGGMLALRTTLAHPERIASLMLMSTASDAPDVLQREVFVKAGGFAESKGMIELQARLEELGRSDEAPLADDAGADQRDWHGRYWAHHRLRHVAMDPFAYGALGLEMMDQVPVTDRLIEITCPTTVLIGTADAEFVRGASLMSAALPNVVEHVLPGVGHQPHQELRAKFLQIVDEHLDRSRQP
jgi:pimeloyl-ACP methyl ester carboxylesterase